MGAKLDRIDFITSLAIDPHGAVNLGNLLLALRDRLLDGDDLTDWIDDAVALARTRGFESKFAGWQAIWNRTDRYQRRGPEASFSHRVGERLIVFSTESKLRNSLKSQTEADPGANTPPTGSADLLATYLLEQAHAERSLGTAKLSVFLPQRLVFYTKLEGEIGLKRDELALETNQIERQRIALYLLRFMGLPVAGGEQWLMTIFKPWTNGAVLQRPTAFDGIDGRYFRQRPDGAVSGNWGRTADLNSCELPAFPTVTDGAAEAIGWSLHAIDVEECVVLPPMPMPSPDDARLSSLYSESLLKWVTPDAADWSESAEQLAFYL